jgi:hypothetical protein
MLPIDFSKQTAPGTLEHTINCAGIIISTTKKAENFTVEGGKMKTLMISMVIGFAAGIIDIIPMIINKLDKKAILSAFLQYFFVSIVILNINLPNIAWWLQGGIVSLCLALPIILIVSRNLNEKKAPPIMVAMSIILGTLISIAGHFII